MEKKNKIRFGILVALLASTTTLFFLSQKAPNTIDPSLFKVEQLDKIDHIILESSNRKTDLRFADGKWKINGEFEADKRLVDVLFATIAQTVPKREVGKLKSDSIAKAVTQSGTTVSLFEGEQLVRKFIAGGNPEKTQSYFQLPEGSTYVMAIPGYRVYVSGIFEADEGVFRDKHIFNFNWRNFKALAVRFPSSPNEDYEIQIKNAHFHIDGISKIDTTKVNEYLDGAFQLNAKEFLSTKKRVAYDSILKTIPAFAVEVKDIANRTYLLEVYPPQSGQADVLGRVGGSEIAVFERNNIISLAKKRNYFEQK